MDKLDKGLKKEKKKTTGKIVRMVKMKFKYIFKTEISISSVVFNLTKSAIFLCNC